MLEKTHSHHSAEHHHRHRSSTDSDPLEPLEEALASPDQETAEERQARQSLYRTRTGHTSVTSAASRIPVYEVEFRNADDEETDASNPVNPKNWPFWKRAWVIFGVSYSTWVVILYSTSYTASISGLMKAFDVHSSTVVTLGVTTYLLGLAVGSLIVAPMSELYGRRWVYIICMSCFTLLVIPAALATSLAEILVVRFFGAVFGAAMVSNSPGTIVDISDEEYRALCMSLWSVAPLNGPVTGPLMD